MKRDTIWEVLGPAVLVLSIATVIIWTSGHLIGMTPEFLKPLSLWFRKPVGGVTTGQLFIMMAFVVSIFGRREW